MLCRVEMPTNEQTFGRFYRYQMLHGQGGEGGGRGNLYMPLLLALVGVFSLVMGLPVWVGGGIIVLALAFVVYMFYVRPGTIFRKKGGIALQTEVYIFTETGLTRSLRSEEGGLPDNSSMRYDGLTRAVETSRDFYLYTSRSQAYLVDKEYFTNGTPDDLRDCLKKTMGDKFKQKK
ncbi:YcxB family protein [Ruminococcaceae bacterium OttesenSCG-928-A16]|nr:YcxB family protein [Ruminococcaceae bacterium OttesenSCG-928-A16]